MYLKVNATFLLNPASVYCIYLQHIRGGYNLGDSGLGHLITNRVAGMSKCSKITLKLFFTLASNKKELREKKIFALSSQYAEILEPNT